MIRYLGLISFYLGFNNELGFTIGQVIIGRRISSLLGATIMYSTGVLKISILFINLWFKFISKQDLKQPLEDKKNFNENEFENL